MVQKTELGVKRRKKEETTPVVRRRRQKSTEKTQELEKKVEELNSEKMNLLLRNEHLRHELYILRRKYERLLEELENN